MNTPRNQLPVADGVQVLAPAPLNFPFEALYTKFEVSADSLVATARIQLKNNKSVFTVDWGDGEISRGFSHRRSIIHNGISDSSVDGEFTLIHVYTEPEDKKAFERFVILKVSSDGIQDLALKILTVVPRYRVTAHSFDFQPQQFEDMIGELSDEWEINLLPLDSDDREESKRWEFSFPGSRVSPMPYYRLEGVVLQHELAEEDVKPYKLEFLEIDPFFDDHLFSTSITLTAHDATERIHLGNDHVNLRYTKLVTLIVPLPAGNLPPRL